MSKLTLDEAIKHCLETAEQLEERANTPYKCEDSELQDNACRECAADHRQLAEWLTELKEAKRLLKAAVDDLRYLESHTVDEKGSCLINDRGERIRCFDCPFNNGGKVNEKCVWNYEAEALKLIGDSEN